MLFKKDTGYVFPAAAIITLPSVTVTVTENLVVTQDINMLLRRVCLSHYKIFSSQVHPLPKKETLDPTPYLMLSPCHTAASSHALLCICSGMGEWYHCHIIVNPNELLDST